MASTTGTFKVAFTGGILRSIGGNKAYFVNASGDLADITQEDFEGLYAEGRLVFSSYMKEDRKLIRVEESTIMELEIAGI